MKKLISLLCIAILILSLFSACSKKEVVIDGYLEFQNVDELIAQIKEAKQKQANGKKLKGEEFYMCQYTSQVYVPRISLSDYSLNQIHYDNGTIVYLYSPNDSQEENYEELIELKFLMPMEDEEHKLQFETRYLDWGGVEIEEGIIYNAAPNSYGYPCGVLSVWTGDTWLQIKVPEHMNTYEQLLQLADYEVIEIP